MSVLFAGYNPAWPDKFLQDSDNHPFVLNEPVAIAVLDLLGFIDEAFGDVLMAGSIRVERALEAAKVAIAARRLGADTSASPFYRAVRTEVGEDQLLRRLERFKALCDYLIEVRGERVVWCGHKHTLQETLDFGPLGEPANG